MNKDTECPICLPHFNELAAPLPFAHCSRSRLICSVSGGTLDENNHPLMLPNGYIYGENVSLNNSNILKPSNQMSFVCN